MMPFCDFSHCEDLAPGKVRDKAVKNANAFKETQDLVRSTDSHNNAATSFAQWVAVLSAQHGTNPADGNGVNTKTDADGGGAQPRPQADSAAAAASPEKYESQATFDDANHARQSRWQQAMSVADSRSDVRGSGNGPPSKMVVAVNTKSTLETNGWPKPSAEETHQQPDAAGNFFATAEEGTPVVPIPTPTGAAAVTKPMKASVAALPSGAASSPASDDYRLNANTPDTFSVEESPHTLPPSSGKKTHGTKSVTGTAAFDKATSGVSPGAVGPLQEPAATQNITGEPELDALQYSRHTNVVAFETERAELYPKASTGTDSIAAGQSLPTENDRRSNEMFSGRAGRQWLVDASFGNGETKMLPDEYQSVAGKSSAVGGMRPNPTNNDLPIHATNKPVEEGSRDRGKAAFLALAGEHQTNTERSSNVVDIKQAASLLRPGKEPTAVESNSAPGPVKPSQSDFSDRASQPSNRIQSPTVAVDQAGRSIESSVADQKIAPRMHIVDEKTGNAIDTIRVSTSANEMPSGNPKGLDQQQTANQPREFKAGTLNTPESGTEFPLRNQADVSRHSEISNATVVNRSGGASLDPVQADFSFQDNEKRMAAGQQVKVADSQTVNGTSDVTKTTTESTKAFQTTVMDQIVSKAAIRSIRGRNEIQIRLKPDFLGNVHMHVVGDKDQMVVRILTDQTVVKDIIETHLHQLKADLKNQGLIIDRFDVMVKTDADHQPSRDAFTQTMNQHSSQNGKRQPQERDPENHNQGSDKKQKDAYSERSGVNYFA